jgi:hypothetical protein
MEYLLGSLVSVGLFFIGKKIFNKTDKKQRHVGIGYSQSHVYNLISPLLRLESLITRKETQASKHNDSLYIKVVIAENKAYWISNNTFFVADEEDGFVDKDTAKPVDTMSMDDVQLNKMALIVEALTEGVEDENRNSGNKNL